MRHSMMGSPASRTVWYAGVLSHCFSESWTATRTCPLVDAGSLMRITNVLVSAADATAHQLIPATTNPATTWTLTGWWLMGVPPECVIRPQDAGADISRGHYIAGGTKGRKEERQSLR